MPKKINEELKARAVCLVQDHCAELPTVTAYVNALSGSVKVVADFGDSQYQIA